MIRIDMDRLQELLRLHRMGTGAREVARLLKMSPNTERLYRQARERAEILHGPIDELPALQLLKSVVREHVSSKPKVQHVSSIEHWIPQIEQMLRVK